MSSMPSSHWPLFSCSFQLGPTALMANAWTPSPGTCPFVSLCPNHTDLPSIPNTLCQKYSPFSTYLAPTCPLIPDEGRPLKSCLPVHSILLFLAHVKFPKFMRLVTLSPINLTVNSTEQGEILKHSAGGTVCTLIFIE